MKRTSQPKVYTGIILSVAGLLLFLLSLIPSILFIVKGNAIYLISVGFLSLAISAWFFIWGGSIIYNYRKSMTAKEKGRTSKCVVLSKRITSSRIEVFFEVLVKYRGQKSGLYYEHKVYVKEDFYTDIKVGDQIRCSVYEDSCYVDPDYPILVA